MMPLALVLVGLEVLVLSWLADDSQYRPRASTDRFLVLPRSKARSRPEFPVTTSETRPYQRAGLGLGLTVCTCLAKTVEAASALVERGQPAFFITANTHYAMLTRENPDLHEVNARAAFIVADGAPLVWAARQRRYDCQSEWRDRT